MSEPAQFNARDRELLVELRAHLGTLNALMATHEKNNADRSAKLDADLKALRQEQAGAIEGVYDHMAPKFENLHRRLDDLAKQIAAIDKHAATHDWAQRSFAAHWVQTVVTWVGGTIGAVLVGYAVVAIFMKGGGG